MKIDLFTTSQDIIRPSEGTEALSETLQTKALQVKGAGGQERALTRNLMGAVLLHDNILKAHKQVKRNKGVA